MIKIFSRLFGASQPLQKPFSNREWRKSEFERLRQCVSPNELVHWIQHYDGYVREAALARSVELRLPELYLPIIERLNDWVPQVRHAARRALLTVLPFASDSAALGSLPIIDRLLLATREDHSKWIEQFEAALLAKVGASPIIDAIHGKNIGLARSCFRVVCKYQLMPDAVLAELTLKSTNDIRTALAALNLANQLEPLSRIELNRIALANKFGAVRTLALRMLLNSGGPNAQALAFDVLLDPQSSVRNAAIWHLNQRGIETESFYANKLEHGDLPVCDTRTCLAALSVGNSDQIDLVKKYLKSSHPRVQASALLAWARLDKGARDGIIIVALTSDAVRVRKLSSLLIKEFGAYIDTDKAVDLALDKADHRLALVLAHRDPWIWLATIVALWTRAPLESSLRDTLVENLKVWIDLSAHIYQKPSAESAKLLASSATRSVLAGILAQDPGRQHIMEYTLAQF